MNDSIGDVIYHWNDWLPIAFLGLMGLSALIYVVLDGFDLGIGLLSPLAEPDERDLMIASIGPFWDANETWLVLAVGLLLVAFPTAHGAVLGALYLPTTAMLIGLIWRGVAFEFRIKGPSKHRRYWDKAFFSGSLLATVSQGYMLGYYVLGLPSGWVAFGFASLVAAGLTTAYALIGSCWLIAKTENRLQQKSILWAKRALIGTAATMLLISLATPLVSARIFAAWFSFPNMLFLAPIPLTAILVGISLWKILTRAAPGTSADNWNPPKHHWTPFCQTTLLFVLGFFGMAYSFFPFVVPESLTIWEAAGNRHHSSDDHRLFDLCVSRVFWKGEIIELRLKKLRGAKNHSVECGFTVSCHACLPLFSWKL